ncbi:iron chelate uptake ABC transporter family permease subunit [Streptococcus mutans]|uniref:iron chelate uptake ABC transporter family permease subunit n=1 Tax=Streptococcus mutans TaxID=1309 RepID=UPI0002FC5EFB|nr:iron chelate uptake ABC transporter family permease subunit [Streptococcus mutans]
MILTFKQKLWLILVLVITLSALYLLYGIGSDVNKFLIIYMVRSRYKRLLAILLTAVCVGASTLIFQTISNNRILTPSIIGLDSVYVFIQTIMLFFLGSQQTLQISALSNYCLSLLIMVGFAFFLFKVLFKQQEYSIYFVLLCGLVLNTLFSSLSSFFQMLIDPNDFLILQTNLFASFNAINTKLLWVSLIIVVFVLLISWTSLRKLDVLLLGKDVAISLGLDYDLLVMKFFILISILISVSTALVGPITFLGLLVVNLAYHIFPTYRHSILLPASILIGMLVLVGGQIIVQYVLTLETQLSVILNFIGGIYFILILLKESKDK